jgi:hypothetical protein
MQLELPLAVAPVAVSAGTLRYIQFGREIAGYRFRRARRRSIGIVIDDDGLRVAGAAADAVQRAHAVGRVRNRRACAPQLAPDTLAAAPH